jgi:lysophospholipase L1-like esterase
MREQILYFVGALLLLPFVPLLIWQGYRLRKNIPKLPEASGPMSGQFGDGRPVLRLLSLGESTFAGVGVSSQQDGITRHIARTIHEHKQVPVHWQVIAKSGYSARQVLEQLVPQLPDHSLDVIVIGLGGNDTFNLNRPLRWRRHMKELIQAIRSQQPNVAIVIASMPAVGHFPAFPRSFQLILGGLVDLHRRVIMALPDQLANTYFMSDKVSWEEWQKYLEPGQDKSDFYSDGVHPSALTYRIWGEQIGRFINEVVGINSP